MTLCFLDSHQHTDSFQMIRIYKQTRFDYKQNTCYCLSRILNYLHALFFHLFLWDSVTFGLILKHIHLLIHSARTLEQYILQLVHTDILQVIFPVSSTYIPNRRLLCKLVKDNLWLLQVKDTQRLKATCICPNGFLDHRSLACNFLLSTCSSSYCLILKE